MKELRGGEATAIVCCEGGVQFSWSSSIDFQ